MNDPYVKVKDSVEYAPFVCSVRLVETDVSSKTNYCLHFIFEAKCVTEKFDFELFALFYVNDAIHQSQHFF